MIIRILSLMLWIGAWPGRAEVREINIMDDIIEEIDKDTLVIFDIDNTVLEPTTYWGSDQWFYFLIDELQEKNNFSKSAALHSAEQIWNRTQSHITTHPVEENTPALIENLQKKGISIMALTARSHAIAAITKQQLLNNRVNFAFNATKNLGLVSIDDNAIYDEGILFQGEGNDKGKTLIKFLAKFNLRPPKIVFIDDKLKNVENVNKALEEIHGLKHIEFRYGYSDKAVADFNSIKSEISDSTTSFSMLGLDNRNIADIIGMRANAILTLKEQGRILMGPGRLSFLQEMAKDPSQLGKDLPRLPYISLGNSDIPHSLRQGKTPEQDLLLIGNLLAQYVKVHNPALVDEIKGPGRIGKFWITEIIYGLSQNFSGPAFELALERSVLGSAEWATPAGTAKQRAAFTLEPFNHNILTVSFTCERSMQNLVDSKKRDVILITTSKVFFNLKEGQVSFLFSYTVDGKGSVRASAILP